MDIETIEMWRCGHCYTEHDHHNDAVECCQLVECITRYSCPACLAEHGTEEEAEDCCEADTPTVGIVLTPEERAAQIPLL